MTIFTESLPYGSQLALLGLAVLFVLMLILWTIKE